MSSYGYPEYPIVQRQTNGLALAGFICSILGLFTGGILSIVGLILCLIALKDEPRGFAWAGIFVSLFGFCLGAILLIVFGAAFLAAIGIVTVAMANFADPIKIETTAEMAMIVAKAEEIKQRDGYPPASLASLGLDSDMLTDAWGQPYRYVLTDETDRGYEIISDGPDGKPETEDDVQFSKLNQMWGGFSRVTVTSSGSENGGIVTLRAGNRTFTIRGDGTGGSIVVDDGEKVVEITGGPDGSRVRTRDSDQHTSGDSGREDAGDESAGDGESQEGGETAGDGSDGV